MACVMPVTVSPGYIGLEYIHTTQGITHHTHTRLVLGLDPGDTGTMAALAALWVGALKGVITPQFTITGYFTQRTDGTHVLSGGFTTPQVGTHSNASGALDYCSRTVTFTGQGTPLAPGDCTGQALSRIFVGAAFEYIARQKVIVAGADAGCDAYRTFLDSGWGGWADYYGMPANSRGSMPVQFNAWAQKRYGT